MRLFEFEDLVWLPARFRKYLTEYLHLLFRIVRPYQAAFPLLEKVIVETNSSVIVDIGSGSGGPWLEFSQQLEGLNRDIKIVLTDYYPSHSRPISNYFVGRVSFSYHQEPVAADSVPSFLNSGIRTFITSFHHLSEVEALAALSDCMKNASGILILEITERSLFALLREQLTFPLFLLLCPFIKPFSWQRLFWTYVLPVAPLITWWDGVVSDLRTRSPSELLSLVSRVPEKDDHWVFEAGKVANIWGGVIYLVGIKK